MGYASCCGTGFVVRRHYTREERAQWLEELASELEAELAGVKERIAWLRGEGEGDADA